MESVYVHIPFCRHICSYCDFCKVLHIDSFVLDYLEALQNEIVSKYEGERISTLYVGGGTPSSLTHEERVKLFRILENFNKTPDCEYTFECNQEDINDELLDDIVQGGVNRISIGVQSFDKNNLTILEREAIFDDIEKKMELIRKRGIKNINIDLMYAIPGEKLSTLKKDINKVIKLKPTHISTYSLIIEDHTILKNNNTEYIDQDDDFKMYELICNKLKKEGYKHYEVSNFALEGYESRHNLNYWNNDEYYGFGLGATGYKAGFRYTNTKNFHIYLDSIFRDNEMLESKQEQMDNEIMLGLRKLEGVNVDLFFEKYNQNIQDVYPKIKELLVTKDLIYKNGYLFINPNKIYVMNEILVKIL